MFRGQSKFHGEVVVSYGKEVPDFGAFSQIFIKNQKPVVSGLVCMLARCCFEMATIR
jgi:hypothetical protein